MTPHRPAPDLERAKDKVNALKTPFTSGLILSESFRAFGANFVPFTTIVLLCSLPAIGFHITGIIQDDILLVRGSQVLSALMMLPAQGAMVYGTVQYMAGHQPTLQENLQQGISCMAEIFAVAIVVMILVMFGLLLFVIPGLILLMMYYVTVPVAVIERGGVWASLERSAELTDGVRMILFSALISVVMLQLLALLGARALTLHVLGFGLDSWVMLAVTSVVELIFGALGATMSAVVYVRLRHQHDNIDAEALSNVFS